MSPRAADHASSSHPSTHRRPANALLVLLLFVLASFLSTITSAAIAVDADQVCDRSCHIAKQLAQPTDAAETRWTLASPDSINFDTELRHTRVVPTAVPTNSKNVPMDAFIYIDPVTQLMFLPRFPDLGALPVFMPIPTLVVISNKDEADLDLLSVSGSPKENCLAWFEQTETPEKVDRFEIPEGAITSSIVLHAKSYHRIRVLVLPTKIDHMMCTLTVVSSRGTISTRVFATGTRNQLLPINTDRILHTMLPWGKVTEIPIAMQITNSETSSEIKTNSNKSINRVDSIFAINNKAFSIVRHTNPPASADSELRVIATIRVRGANPGLYQSFIHVSGSFGLIVIPCSVTVLVGALTVTPPVVDFGQVSFSTGDYDQSQKVSVDLVNYAQEAVAVLDAILSPPCPLANVLTIALSKTRVISPRGGVLVGALTVGLDRSPNDEDNKRSRFTYEGTVTLVTNNTNPLRARVIIPISLVLEPSPLLASPAQVHMRLLPPPGNLKEYEEQHAEAELMQPNGGFVSQYVHLRNHQSFSVVIERISLLEFENVLDFNNSGYSTPHTDEFLDRNNWRPNSKLKGCLSLDGIVGLLGATAEASTIFSTPLVILYNQTSPECIIRGSLHAKVVISASRVNRGGATERLLSNEVGHARATTMEIPIFIYGGGMGVGLVKTSLDTLIRPLKPGALKKTTCVGFPISDMPHLQHVDRGAETYQQDEVPTECIQIDVGFVADTARLSVMIGVRNLNPIPVQITSGFVSSSAGALKDESSPPVLVKWVDKASVSDAAIAKAKDTKSATPGKLVGLLVVFETPREVTDTDDPKDFLKIVIHISTPLRRVLVRLRVRVGVGVIRFTHTNNAPALMLPPIFPTKFNYKEFMISSAIMGNTHKRSISLLAVVTSDPRVRPLFNRASMMSSMYLQPQTVGGVVSSTSECSRKEFEQMYSIVPMFLVRDGDDTLAEEQCRETERLFAAGRSAHFDRPVAAEELRMANEIHTEWLKNEAAVVANITLFTLELGPVVTQVVAPLRRPRLVYCFDMVSQGTCPPPPPLVLTATSKLYSSANGKRGVSSSSAQANATDFSAYEYADQATTAHRLGIGGSIRKLQRIDFEPTRVGKVSVRYLRVHNPSIEPMLVELSVVMEEGSDAIIRKRSKSLSNATPHACANFNTQRSMKHDSIVHTLPQNPRRTTDTTNPHSSPSIKASVMRPVMVVPSTETLDFESDIDVSRYGKLAKIDPPTSALAAEMHRILSGPLADCASDITFVVPDQAVLRPTLVPPGSSVMIGPVFFRPPVTSKYPETYDPYSLPEQHRSSNGGIDGGPCAEDCRARSSLARFAQSMLEVIAPLLPASIVTLWASELSGGCDYAACERQMKQHAHSTPKTNNNNRDCADDNDADDADFDDTVDQDETGSRSTETRIGYVYIRNNLTYLETVELVGHVIRGELVVRDAGVVQSTRSSSLKSRPNNDIGTLDISLLPIRARYALAASDSAVQARLNSGLASRKRNMDHGKSQGNESTHAPSYPSWNMWQWALEWLGHHARVHSHRTNIPPIPWLACNSRNSTSCQVLGVHQSSVLGKNDLVAHCEFVLRNTGLDSIALSDVKVSMISGKSGQVYVSADTEHDLSGGGHELMTDEEITLILEVEVHPSYMLPMALLTLGVVNDTGIEVFATFNLSSSPDAQALLAEEQLVASLLDGIFWRVLVMGMVVLVVAGVRRVDLIESPMCVLDRVSEQNGKEGGETRMMRCGSSASITGSEGGTVGWKGGLTGDSRRSLLDADLDDGFFVEELQYVQELWQRRAEAN